MKTESSTIKIKVDTQHKTSARAYPRAYFFTSKKDDISYYRKTMSKVIVELGLPPNTKFKWSKIAGCGCGCSPGFILNVEYDQDIFVNF